MNVLRKAGLFLMGLLPLAASAETIRPAGGNTWDLYVYGNGQAIASILTAIKLMIAPDSGGQSFTYLLLFLATLGFLVMAIRTGFDPAKNLLKMFAFIFIVWMVHYATNTARTNVEVYDRFGQPGANDFVISGVPALVGIPAAVVSQAGEFLTQQIEQNFALPYNADSSTMDLSSGGQYALFAKLMSDASKYTITDPDIRRSVTAYISDCGVTAIALGQMSTNDLMSNPNMMDVLSKAQNNAIMTRYYPSQALQSSCSLAAGSSAPSGQGTLASCVAVYNCLATDLPAYANALLQASSSQWQSSGVVTPLETAMTSALQMAGAAGSGNQFAGYSSPQGYILQNAMLSVSSGAFRDAAARTGNNEIMMATSVAQAEQSQRTSWWTASEIFKNMMGYVFTVLQAFIFAMVPVIVICLMIPGMGGKIFMNYAQIMVWLTLWAPMLAIVNFLVEIFGSAQMSGTLGAAGLTMQNRAIVTDQANNLVIVAQFMGTLVPIMTWGLVKGALAFTEFISHGIGSSFATQAGAQAATGNVSMGNLSMDNVGMNKYSTAMTSNVGVQSVKADFGAGAGTGIHDQGGNVAKASEGLLNVTTGLQRQFSYETATHGRVTLSETEARSFMAQNSKMSQEARSFSDSLNNSIARAEDFARTRDKNDKVGQDEVAKVQAALNDTVAAGIQYRTAVATKVGAGTPGSQEGGLFALSWGIGASAEAARSKLWQQQAALNQAIDLAEAKSHSAGSSTSASSKLSGGVGYNESGGTKIDTSRAHALTHALSEVAQRADSLSSERGFSITESTTRSANHVSAFDGTTGGLHSVGADNGSGLKSEFEARGHAVPSSSDVIAGSKATGTAMGADDARVNSGTSEIRSSAVAAGADSSQLKHRDNFAPMDASEIDKTVNAAREKGESDYATVSGDATRRYISGKTDVVDSLPINPFGTNFAQKALDAPPPTGK